MSKQINGPLYNQVAEEQKVLFYGRKILSNIKEFKSFNGINDDNLRKISSKIETLFPDDKYPLRSKKRYLAVLNI